MLEYRLRWWGPQVPQRRATKTGRSTKEGGAAARPLGLSRESPSLPILLAINGTIFDVSASPHTYGPDGNYHGFTGRNAGRAFVTGCFEEDLHGDLRGGRAYVYFRLRMLKMVVVMEEEERC